MPNLLAAFLISCLSIVLGAFAIPSQVLASYHVVLDPGHGGRDGGAIGREGTREKDIVLNVAKHVRDMLRDVPDVTVTMTREADKALRLDDRVAIGRAAAANLFVSIHADSMRSSRVRGASIYTLAEQASDQLSASLAEGQDRSDVLAGFDAPRDEPEVADILLDLMRRETEAFSEAAANSIVSVLRPRTRMIRNPHRSANFRVLRAPDVPSILVELGYLSNRDDERQLRDPAWQREIAAALTSAIVAHARETGALPPAED